MATLSKEATFGQPGMGWFNGTIERQMKEGSGNGAFLIKLIWSIFWI